MPLTGMFLSVGSQLDVLYCSCYCLKVHMFNQIPFNRVMFGSDQMIWPSAITSSINFLNSLDFLTEEEKEMILYKNARVFLGIKNQ